MWEMEIEGQRVKVSFEALDNVFRKSSHGGWVRTGYGNPTIDGDVYLDTAVRPKKPECGPPTWTPSEVTIGFGRAVKYKDGKIVAVVENIEDEHDMNHRVRMIAASEKMLECLKYASEKMNRHVVSDEMLILKSYIDDVIQLTK